MAGSGGEHLTPAVRRWRAFRRSASGRVGAVIVGLVVLAAVFGPLVAGDPYHIPGGTRLLPPGETRLFLVDANGQLLDRSSPP